MKRKLTPWEKSWVIWSVGKLESKFGIKKLICYSLSNIEYIFKYIQKYVLYWYNVERNRLYLLNLKNIGYWKVIKGYLSYSQILSSYGEKRHK